MKARLHVDFPLYSNHTFENYVCTCTFYQFFPQIEQDLSCFEDLCIFAYFLFSFSFYCKRFYFTQINYAQLNVI